MVHEDDKFDDAPAFETEGQAVETHRFKLADETRVREYLRRMHVTGKLVIDIVHGGTNQIYFIQTQDADFES